MVVTFPRFGRVCLQLCLIVLVLLRCIIANLYCAIPHINLAQYLVAMVQKVPIVDNI